MRYSENGTFHDVQFRHAKASANNPVPIITRSRAGLQKDHPFYINLRAAVEAVLREVVSEEEARAEIDAT
jgi:hypothetical protein